MKTLNRIQKELKAPKGQTNKFGGYKYRSCEDILEEVKKHLGDAVLTISDDIQQIGDRYYVKATATLIDGEQSVSVTAYAREALDKRGMDESQITGAASSYARKYALNGLFCIDDTKDADTQDNTIINPVEKKKVESAPRKVEVKSLGEMLMWIEREDNVDLLQGALSRLTETPGVDEKDKPAIREALTDKIHYLIQ
jgi:hypothetical protein